MVKLNSKQRINLKQGVGKSSMTNRFVKFITGAEITCYGSYTPFSKHVPYHAIRQAFEYEFFQAKYRSKFFLGVTLELLW